MAKCRTTIAGLRRTSQATRHYAVSREGVAPENTPQRVSPHFPILRKHNSGPFVKSTDTLARRMQPWGAGQRYWARMRRLGAVAQILFGDAGASGAALVWELATEAQPA
jgi:hypothetical protein